ncbi:MAG: hypothetical protein ACFFBD_06025 [Candidatus Hodarchaeota archaeon]
MMNDLENFKKAMHHLGDYERYQIRKTWGVTIILLGLPSLVGYPTFATLFGGNLITWAFFMIPCFLLALFVVYKFIALKRPIYRNGNLLAAYNVNFGLGVVIMFFFSTGLSFFFFFRLTFISSILKLIPSCSSLMSFF